VSIVNQKSQQLAVGAHLTPALPPRIEIEQSIYEKLSEICLVEKISLKVLASRLLLHMLVYHKKEVKEIVERIKCPASW
jgi:hypothetical protein